MPSDALMHGMNRIHRMLQRVSGGRLGWSIAGMPVLELTTTGRKSGARRTSLLTSPLQTDGGYVIVASRGGDERHPAWFLNLRDEPRVDVRLDRHAPRAATARIATPEERADWWPRITSRYANYAGYQRRTDREIPLVLVTLDA